MRLYRAAQDLEDFGLATIKKDGENYASITIGTGNKPKLRSDGFMWIAIDRKKILDLIRADSKKRQLGDDEKDLIKGYCEIPTDVNLVISKEIKPRKLKKSVKRDIYDMPKTVSGSRKAAIRFLMGVNMLDWKENDEDRRKKRRSRGPYPDAKTLINLFKSYSDDTIKKIIVLMHKITGDTVGSDYSTRFNDFHRGIEKLRAYEYAHDKSLEDHSRAVFLTLTTDPKLFPSLWVANRHMSIAFNQFLQNLTNTLGGRSKRLKYMAASEYTKTGLIHLHILIFDHTYLFSPDGDIDKHIISDLWQKCGQGKIVEAYGLKNTLMESGKREWRWFGRDQPSDAKGMSGGDYLKKYLKKCMMAIIDQYNDPANTLFPYWAFNKRFFTCSRSFLPPKEKLEEKAHTSLYVPHFIGYDMSLEQAVETGLIDRIGYRRWMPKDDNGPPDESYSQEAQS